MSPLNMPILSKTYVACQLNIIGIYEIATVAKKPTKKKLAGFTNAKLSIRCGRTNTRSKNIAYNADEYANTSKYKN